MPSVKRTFTIPDDISVELDAEVPNRERSKFIASSIREALRKRKRGELFDLLATIPRKKNVRGMKSEDVLRKIRSERAEEIISHS